MSRLDPLAKVGLTPNGPEFNRFSLQVVRIETPPEGPTFYNTAAKTHATTIPNAVVIATGTTRIYQAPSDPPNVVRCASDNGKHPAFYIRDPIDDLCLICRESTGACIATTPTVVASRELSGWRVLRVDLTGEHAGRAREWEKKCFIDWNLEHEADLSIGLDAEDTVELRLGAPRRLSRRHERELLALWKLLQHLPLHAVTLKAVTP